MHGRHGEGRRLALLPSQLATTNQVQCEIQDVNQLVRRRGRKIVRPDIVLERDLQEQAVGEDDVRVLYEQSHSLGAVLVHQPTKWARLIEARCFEYAVQ